MAKKNSFKKEILEMSRHKYNEQYKYNPSYKKLMAKCKKEKEAFFYKIPL